MCKVCKDTKFRIYAGEYIICKFCQTKELKMYEFTHSLEDIKALDAQKCHFNANESRLLKVIQDLTKKVIELEERLESLNA